jgi:hypothetical protein
VAILPLRYLEEVKNAPQSKLSFPLFMEKVFEVRVWMWAARDPNHNVVLGFGYQRHLRPRDDRGSANHHQDGFE